MSQSQLFAISVRILGVYLLVQAVLQVPEGIVYSVALCILWLHGDHTPFRTSMQVYPQIWSTLLGFIIFAAAGVYLVRGAPHLFRLAGVPAADQQVG